MKGIVTIYFGKKNNAGFVGETADTIKLASPDVEATVKSLTEYRWAMVKTDNGEKFINTQNILWFEVEKENDVK